MYKYIYSGLNSPEQLHYIKENTGTLETYTDAEVEAKWDYNNHAQVVGSYGEMTSAQLSIVKIGSKLPDTSSYLKYSKGLTDSFHGHYNYIANYMYVMRLARVCETSGLWEALRVTPYPCNSEGSSQIYNGILELNNNWNSVLAGKTINNRNKALVLVGIATHIAMDTYAHKAYLKDSLGKWTIHIEGNDLQDSTSYVSARWTCAKDIAYDILSVWNDNMTPDAFEFYQPSHGKNQFRLYKLATYAKNADRSTYNGYATWFENRTCDKK